MPQKTTPRSRKAPARNDRSSLLDNRIENLFADLGQSVAPAPVSDKQAADGWTWICNSQGLYTYCSPEVESILGYRPSDFIGQPVTEFALQPRSRLALKTALFAGRFPIEICQHYISSYGKSVTSNLLIMVTPGEDSSSAQWRGVSQVIQTSPNEVDSLQFEVPPDKSDGSPEQTLINAQDEPIFSFINQDGNPKDTSQQQDIEYNRIIPTGPNYLPKLASSQQTADHLQPGGNGTALTAQIQLQDQSVGLLEIEGSPNYHWNEDDQRLVEQVADQLSLALENARLFQAEQRRANELNTILNLSRIIGRQLSLEEVFVSVHQAIERLMVTEAFFINLRDRQTDEVITSYFVDRGVRQPEARFPLTAGLTGYVIRTGLPQLIRDLDADQPQFNGVHMGAEHVRAVIAVPLVFNDEVIGSISTQSYQPAAFDEYDLHLLGGIADHVAIAIENARLFEEQRQRSTQLSALHEISLELAQQQREFTTLLEVITGRARSLLNVDGSGIWLWREPSQELILVSYSPEESTPMIARRLKDGEGFAGRAYHGKRTQVINDYQTWEERSVIFEDATFVSVIAIPMVWQTQVIGVLTANRNQPNRPFTPSEVNLAELLTAQAAAVIQNAYLFTQTEEALSALKVSEFYQKNVAQAVATLTESGTQSLPEVLRILGEAARSSRAYYYAVISDEHELYWRKIAGWINPQDPIQTGENELQQIPVKTASRWANSLIDNGFFTVTISEFTPADVQLLEPYQVKSMILLAVPGKNPVPGFLGFIETTYERAWHQDERSGLLTAASALSSTIAREDLFSQVQSNLAETELLYHASADLNSAQSYDEILAVLRNHTVLGHKYATDVSLNLFNLPWKGGKLPEWLISIAHWSNNPELSTRVQPYPIGTWGSTPQIMHPREIIFIEDTSKDNRLDQDARGVFVEHLKAKSILFAPLSVSGSWIGEVVAAFSERVKFPKEALWKLFTLNSQAAVSIENRRLLTETRRRNEELTALNAVSSATSRSLNLLEILEEVISWVLKTSAFDAGLVSILDPDKDRLILMTHRGLPEAFLQRLRKQGLNGTLCELVWRRKETLVLDDLARTAPLDTSGMLALGLRAYLGVPLESKGKIVGTLCAFSKTTRNTQISEIALMRAIGQQVGVAVENARLFAQTQTALGRTQSLYQVSRSVLNIENTQELLRSLTETIAQSLPADRVMVVTFNPEAGQINDLVQGGPGKGIDPIPAAYRPFEFLMDGLTGWVMRESQPVLLLKNIPDPRESTEIRRYRLEANAGSVIIVPLQLPGKTRGTLSAINRLDQPDFRQQDVEMLTAMASQVAVAIENRSLFEQTQQALMETADLYKASAALNASQTYDDILALLRERTLLKENARIISISLFNHPWIDEHQPEWYHTVAYWSRFPEEKMSSLRYPLNTIPSYQQLLRPDAPTIIADVATDSRLEEASRGLYLNYYGASSLCYVPLNLAGRWIGYLSAIFEEEIHYSKENINRLMVLAQQAAVAIEGLRLLEDSRRRASQLEIAAQIARETSGTLSLGELLKSTANLIRDRFGYYHASIFLLDDEGIYAVIQESTGIAGEELKRRGHKLAVGSQSIIGYVTQTGKALIVNDVSKDPTHRVNPFLPDTRAEAGIPLKIGNLITGALDVQANEINAFTTDDISVIQILADQIAVAVHNARLYEDQRQTAERLREVDKLKSQFLANMSHELRTPLNSIIGFSRVIIKGIDGPVTDLQKQDLSAVYSSGQHLLNMINDILDLSKIEAGKMEISIEDVNLVDLFNSVMSTAKALVKDKLVELRLQINDLLPHVQADPTRIRQVMINLLSNAAKFTEEGSITITADVQAGPEDGTEVIVGVTDTGTGIALEDQAKLFEPFSQVDSSPTRKTGGTGLGLSICRAIIEMHKGRIGIISEPGKGSTFYFTLPLPKPVTPRPAKTSPLKLSRMILVIEDNRQLVGIYDRYLRNYDFQVVPLNDAAYAIVEARRIKPYAIMLDVVLPGHDGWEILKKLKEEPDTRDIPVIICSILDEMEKGQQLGAAAYLTKPILEEDLVNVVLNLNH